MSYKISKSDEEWKKILSSEQFEVCRNKGTERAFTGIYWDSKDKGMYNCTCPSPAGQGFSNQMMNKTLSM